MTRASKAVVGAVAVVVLVASLAATSDRWVPTPNGEADIGLGVLVVVVSLLGFGAALLGLWAAVVWAAIASYRRPQTKADTAVLVAGSVIAVVASSLLLWVGLLG